MTRDDIRGAILRAGESVSYTLAVAEEDDTIIKGSPAWGLKEALENVEVFLSRLSWNIYVRGLEAAEPGELPRQGD